MKRFIKISTCVFKRVASHLYDIVLFYNQTNNAKFFDRSEALDKIRNYEKSRIYKKKFLVIVDR